MLDRLPAVHESRGRTPGVGRDLVSGALGVIEHSTLEPPLWWACREPERPYDVHAAFEDDCPLCGLALLAAVKNRRLTSEAMLMHIDARNRCDGFRSVTEILQEHGLDGRG